jgi:adenylate cyclase class IV
MNRPTSPRFEVDEPGFHAFLRQHSSSVVNTVSISQVFFDTPDSHFRRHRQVVRLRTVSASGFQEQFDFRIKEQGGKAADDSHRPSVSCAILTPKAAHDILDNPSRILAEKDELLPASIRGWLVGIAARTMRQAGRILTKRRYLAVGDILIKADEMTIGQATATFFTIGLMANEFEPAKEKVKGILNNLKVRYRISQNSAFSKLIGENQ